MKTFGQRLYEYENPEYIEVIRWKDRTFATSKDILLVKNPADPTPWRFLTKGAQEKYEQRAKGHHIFS